MNWNKRAGALALAALLAVSLSACAGGDQTAEVEAAQAKLEAAESFDSVYRTELEYSVEDEEGGEARTMSVVNEMAVTLFTAPEPRLKASATVEATAGEESMSQNTNIYMLREGEGYSQYLNIGERWAKMAVEASAMEEMKPADSIQLFLTEGAAYRKVGTETLEGGNAVKYESTIKGAALVETLDGVGLLKSISSMSEDQQNRIKDDLEKNLKGQAVHIWVDEAGGYPVRYEMDLTGTMAEAEASISKTLGGYDGGDSQTLTRAVISMTCTRFNDATEIVLPDEAAGAEVLG